ncbi:MAG: S-methyl-5-thioribose-1-phosphate isomerase [Candidatus Melainabacteria bacterium]|nr:S-methyl-5-thioribose-1-phosphate isomerase [Candidatus Melainabacteria bacterium]
MFTSSIRPIRSENGRILVLDQRKLPHSVEYFDATRLDDMCFAIKEMVVRGAPAIGVAAALALACEGQRLSSARVSPLEFLSQLEKAKGKLEATRPTAVNLRWGAQLIFKLAQDNLSETLDVLAARLVDCARGLIEEDIAINLQIGERGAKLIGDASSVLTHCNAGALATCGWGTALGVIRSAVKLGAHMTVYVDETRPRQQGARLTAWELLEDNIQPTVIADSVAGYLMSKKMVDVVIVGADRITLNGDTANKIGTYTLAVLANVHNVPFYVAAPLSTIDAETLTGKDIPIEERDPHEVTSIGGMEICPEGVNVLNPAFDVTPGRLISAIITEVGIFRPPYEVAIQEALNQIPGVNAGVCPH